MSFKPAHMHVKNDGCFCRNCIIGIRTGTLALKMMITADDLAVSTNFTWQQFFSIVMFESAGALELIETQV